jgi:hypothetical protein
VVKVARSVVHEGDFADNNAPTTVDVGPPKGLNGEGREPAAFKSGAHPVFLEDSVGPRQLYYLGASLAQSVIARHAQRVGGPVRRVTIDMDPTGDPTDGAQQL